jgi:OmpA-OmpF porin, OOP family
MEIVSAVLVAIAAGVLLAQPAPDRIILLPAPDGSVGKVIVQGADGAKQLDTAYASLSIDKSGNTSDYHENAQAIDVRYGELLAAQPSRPRSYILYFLSGGTELAPESQQELEAIKQDVLGRPVPDIRVVGYTDTVGATEANDALSLERTKSVVEFLRNAGVRAQTFEAVGRGERELPVYTKDGVAEPKNRRVEISIR